MPSMVLDFVLTQGTFVLDVHERLNVRALALSGPSGAGKTTVLDAIAGLRPPDAGEIAIGERVLFSSVHRINLPPHLRRVGYLTQDVALFPHMNVQGNVFYGRRSASGLDPARVLGILEIGALLPRSIATLSGGERQRVALARALLSSPDLLLLDEPLAAVDVELRTRILPYLRRVRDELAVPIMYVSHDPAEAAAVADHVIDLDHGTARLRPGRDRHSEQDR